MNKPLKYLLIGVGVVVVLLAGALTAAATLFDPNDYRDTIAAKVKEQTGRDLQIGEIGLKVFPWLKASAKGVVLGNAPGFGSEPFAQVGEADVGVKLFPLLFDKKVEVSTVKLSGLRLNLQVDKDGKNNWADLVKEKPEDEKKPKDEQGFNPKSLDISGVEISDSSARYSDARSGKSYQIDKLRLETGALRPGNPFDVNLGLTAIASAPAATADVELKSTVDYQAEADTIKLSGLTLKLKAAGKQIAGGKDANADIELSGGAVVDMAKKLLNTQELKLKLKGQGMGFDADTELAAAILADYGNKLYNAKGLVFTGTVAGADVPGGKQPLKLSGDFSYDGAKGNMAFQQGALAVAGLDLKTSIIGEGLGEGGTPRLHGPISVAPFNPRPLMQQLGIKLETADPEVLKNVSLAANYSGSFTSARFNDLNMKLDQTTMRGMFGISNFKAKAMEMGLKIDEINADRYLPPKKPGQEKPVAAAGNKNFNDQPLPTEALKKLNANGTLDIGKLTINGMKLSNVSLKLSGAPGATQAQDISAQLYGGKVSLTNRMSPGAQPGYAIKTQLSALQAAPFLKDLIGKEPVSGLGNFDVSLNSHGNTYGEFKKALNGDLSFRVENGSVKGFNLAQTVRKAQAALGGNLNDTETEAPQTDFSVFSASARIIDGVLKSDLLDAASPLFRVSGQGQVDLVNETINYLATPTIVNTITGQGGKGLEQLKGIAIPIRLSGNMYKPKVSLDLKAALQQKATEKVRDELTNKLGDKLGIATTKDGKKLDKQELKQELNNKLGDLLFGKKKKKEEAAPATAPAPATPPAEPAPAPAK
ncbi:AsmA family protein [Solimonas sp. K1W22B-7]|uniref:AsmA family protein n=1 Tax=Solimonas sp. K1W22B-7 TaxID=2303331 RepID=UPI000E336DFB|nr:AsmA family protein [Solimonas sp. K1W22B-7]AXQ31049.1 AsmA family protein [Solimonas sp. K1W22B-7]